MSLRDVKISLPPIVSSKIMEYGVEYGVMYGPCLLVNPKLRKID
jgi:hypothetical protein